MKFCEIISTYGRSVTNIEEPWDLGCFVQLIAHIFEHIALRSLRCGLLRTTSHIHSNRALQSRCPREDESLADAYTTHAN